jgi:RHS repeat-associated protein
LSATYNAQEQATNMTVGSNAMNMTYTGMGQSERLTNGASTYQYDATGVSNLNGGTTTFVHTPDGDVISERIGTVTLGGGGGTTYATYYYLYDGLGSVVAVADASGNIRDTYSYDPYGNTTSVSEPVSNPFRFTGAIWDSASGLYKMGERFYDPAVGRFTQPDPSGQEGYTYAGDNPTNNVDPEGLKHHHKHKHKKHKEDSKAQSSGPTATPTPVPAPTPTPTPSPTATPTPTAQVHQCSTDEWRNSVVGTVSGTAGGLIGIATAESGAGLVLAFVAGLGAVNSAWDLGTCVGKFIVSHE